MQVSLIDLINMLIIYLIFRRPWWICKSRNLHIHQWRLHIN